jgi:hypothetical protein
MGQTHSPLRATHEVLKSASDREQKIQRVSSGTDF